MGCRFAGYGRDLVLRVVWLGVVVLVVAHRGMWVWYQHRVATAVVYDELPGVGDPGYVLMRWLGMASWLALLVAWLVTVGWLVSRYRAGEGGRALGHGRWLTVGCFVPGFHVVASTRLLVGPNGGSLAGNAWLWVWPVALIGYSVKLAAVVSVWMGSAAGGGPAVLVWGQARVDPVVREAMLASPGWWWGPAPDLLGGVLLIGLAAASVALPALTRRPIAGQPATG